MLCAPDGSCSLACSNGWLTKCFIPVCTIYIGCENSEKGRTDRKRSLVLNSNAFTEASMQLQIYNNIDIQGSLYINRSSYRLQIVLLKLFGVLVVFVSSQVLKLQAMGIGEPSTTQGCKETSIGMQNAVVSFHYCLLQ